MVRRQSTYTLKKLRAEIPPETAKKSKNQLESLSADSISQSDSNKSPSNSKSPHHPNTSSSPTKTFEPTIESESDYS